MHAHSCYTSYTFNMAYCYYIGVTLAVWPGISLVLMSNLASVMNITADQRGNFVGLIDLI